jgi:HSP20 family protein
MAFADLLPAFRRTEPTFENFLMPLHRQIDRLFEDFWSSSVPLMGAKTRSFLPRVDIVDSDKDIHVTAELPGMDESDVEIILDKRLLTLRGEKRAEREEHDHGRMYVERACGTFERQIPLASEVEEDKVEATFNRGVLSIVLPKSAEARSKTHKIKIQGSASKEARSKSGLFKGRNGGQDVAAAVD